MVRKNKVAFLLLSIIFVALGVIMMVAPFFTGAVYLPWVIIGLLGASGLGALFVYIFPGKGNKRNGFVLGYGLIITLCVVAVILCGVFANAVIYEGQEYPGWVAVSVRIIVFLSIFFGILNLLNEIFTLCTINNVPRENRGWTIAWAILGIAFSVLMIVFPFVMWIVGVVIAGVYFTLTGFFVLGLVIKNWSNKEIQE